MVGAERWRVQCWAKFVGPMAITDNVVRGFTAIPTDITHGGLTAISTMKEIFSVLSLSLPMHICVVPEKMHCSLSDFRLFLWHSVFCCSLIWYSLGMDFVTKNNPVYMMWKFMAVDGPFISTVHVVPSLPFCTFQLELGLCPRKLIPCVVRPHSVL